MRAQLYNEPPLTVSPSLAAAVGLNEAIVLQQVHYWTQNSEKNGRNLVDGRYWVYRTYADWGKDFPFWCDSTIRGIIRRLESAGLLLSGNHKKMPMDKTKWYAIDYTELDRRITEYEEQKAAEAAG